MLSPFIEKEGTILRKSISAHERLTATLRFLATGCSYKDLKFSTRIAPGPVTGLYAVARHVREVKWRLPETNSEDTADFSTPSGRRQPPAEMDNLGRSKAD